MTALRAALNTFILYCVSIQRTYLPISHINVRMLHRWGDCGTEHHSRNTEGDADSVEETSLAFLIHF